MERSTVFTRIGKPKRYYPTERVAGGNPGPKTHPGRRLHVGYRFARANEPDNMPPVGFPVADHAPSTVDTKPATGGIRFDRNELSGAFGDVGTDLPLIFGLILAARLDTASVLVLFGAMQLVTALAYRMPMPVQPLKAMAAL